MTKKTEYHVTTTLSCSLNVTQWSSGATFCDIPSERPSFIQPFQTNKRIDQTVQRKKKGKKGNFPPPLLFPLLCVEGQYTHGLNPWQISNCMSNRVMTLIALNCIFNYLYIFIFITGFVHVNHHLLVFHMKPHYLYITYKENNRAPNSKKRFLKNALACVARTGNFTTQ